MMSLYADDAVLTAHENKVYPGKEQVRTYWVDVSGPFVHSAPSITGSATRRRCGPRVMWQETVPRSTLECLWMDVDSNAIGAHAFSSMDGKVDKL